jgi:hypothetical protein
MDNTANPSIGNNGVIIRDAQDTTITGCTMRNYLKSAARAIYMVNLNGTSGNGKVNANVSISNCVIEQVDYGIVDESGLVGLTITGCVLKAFSQTSAGSCGIGLLNTSTFTISGSTLMNGSGTHGSNEGLILYGAHDGTVSGCSFSGNQGNDAMIIQNTCYDVVVTGNRFGPSNANNTFRVYDAGSYNITVSGNDFVGNPGTGFSWNASGGTGSLFVNNLGYNPVGVQSVSVPSSTVAVTAKPFDRDFYVTNGAASSTFVVANGPTITVPINGFATIRVPAGKTLTPTYSSAPTWVVEGL